jgi:hypothetical protein
MSPMLRQLGLPVRLRVMKVNPRALAFYERLGFMRTGETDTHDLMEWQQVATVGTSRCTVPPLSLRVHMTSTVKGHHDGGTASGVVAPHEHWHTDVSYLNVCGTFYYLCSVLDAVQPVEPALGDP